MRRRVWQPSSHDESSIDAALSDARSVASRQLPGAPQELVAVPMQRPPAGHASEHQHAPKKLDAHDTGSKSLWRSMYTGNDPAIAETVYELYKADFDAFGYEKESFHSKDES